MLSHVELSVGYWEFLRASAVHVFNMTPRRSGSTMAPLEAIIGKKPSLDHLRVFGCPAYVHVPSQRRTKMEAPSRKGLFVGYSPSSQSWIIYLPSTRTILSSHSVTFDEEWRSLSPMCALSAPASSPRGAALIEREPFLYKHLVTYGRLVPFTDYTSFQKVPIAAHSRDPFAKVLPPRPTSPTIPSLVHTTLADNGATLHPQSGTTRLGHKFRDDAPPFVPSGALHSIPEDDDSSNFDYEGSHTNDMPSVAPRNGLAPTQRYQAPTPTPTGSAISLDPPPLGNAVETKTLAESAHCAAPNAQPDLLTACNHPICEHRKAVLHCLEHQPTPHSPSQISHSSRHSHQSFLTLAQIQSRIARRLIRQTVICGRS